MTTTIDYFEANLLREMMKVYNVQEKKYIELIDNLYRETKNVDLDNIETHLNDVGMIIENLLELVEEMKNE